MKRRTLVLIGVMASLIIVGGIITLAPRPSPHAPAAATYYCPMHPTYTSDSPGDCPICSMKLVKREAEPAPSPEPSQAGPVPPDICYLHNCPLAHEGSPCPMLVVAKAGESVTCPVCGSHVVTPGLSARPRKILYWTDPMIPGYKADQPGTSPMGMALVPVYEENGAPLGGSTTAVPPGYAPVLVSPQKQQLIGVRTALVERRRLEKTIRTVGTVAHDPELYQAQAEYLEALRAVEGARQGGGPEVVEQAARLVEAGRIRLRHLGLSNELIAEISTWKEPEHSLLFAHPGEPVWMYAKAYEYELPLIRVGQAVAAQAPAFPDRVFTGTVRAIDPMVDPATRTTRVRVQLQDPEGRLAPDMYVDVSLTVDLGEQLALPGEAVFDTGTQRIVFVDKGQGLFEPRAVTMGVKADAAYEVKEGVREGERVVTSGNFLIDSESRLKAALEGFTGSAPVEQSGKGHEHGP